MRRILLTLATLCSMLVAIPATQAHAAATISEVTGVHQLVNAQYNDCLTVVGGSSVNSNPIWHHPCDQSPLAWTQWIIDYEATVTFCFASQGNTCVDRRTRNIYRLRSNHTGKCIEPHNGATNSGARIDQYDCRMDTYRQSWIIVEAQGGGYFFYNAKVYDEAHKERGIDAAPYEQDRQVRIWTANQTPPQIWYLR
ncbi:RICIN domain-containing protein [Rhizocola hellebori]|nr:RICIN domain-containing protein [Rhizocola hellebori]